MQSKLAYKQAPAASGVIDTIAAGLSVALVQPLLMLVPLLTDLYFWIGWRIAPAAVTEPIRQWLLDSKQADAKTVGDGLSRLGHTDMTAVIVAFDVPSLLAGADRSHLYQVASRPMIQPGHWWSVCLILVGLLAGAALIFAAYAVPLADAAIGRSRPAAAVARAIVLGWLRFLGLVGLGAALIALILGPPVVLGAVMQVVGINLAPILGPLMLVVGLVVVLYLFFAPDAIVVSEVGPLRAMYFSFNVVRRNFRQTFGFAVAGLIISSGLNEIWMRLFRSAPGLLIAVVANAFFAGGLAMASMIFFFDRLRLWRPEAVIRSNVPS